MKKVPPKPKIKRNRPVISATIHKKVYEDFEKVIKDNQLNKSKVINKLIENLIKKILS